ncbi:MAG TPA: tetratricopeptide repeat protein [Terriglobia bacterium]|nr:tetratricopeptide repeat protein [Terriglobia bacterium]
MPGSSSKWPRRLAILLPAVIAFVLIAAWVLKTYLATRLGDRVTLYNLRLAEVLDPTSETYQLGLGRFYQYNPADMNPDEAMVHIKRAVELDPYDPQAWLDLGAALEFQGNTTQAEVCLRRADFLAPNLPPIQWAIANFFLLHGNLDEAFKHFKVVLQGSKQFNQVVFSTAWKASGDAPKILDELIPPDPDAEFAYLDYLRSQGNFDAARAVWKRIIENPQTFGASRAAGYIDGLIQSHRAAEAYGDWNDLRAKGLLPTTYAEKSTNLIVNPDFEEPLQNFGFDWRIFPIDGAYATQDQTTFHSPTHSLLIQFLGTQNVTYQHVIQFVRVDPNHSYRLEGFIRTQGITTDSGVRFEVRDSYNPRLLDQMSEELIGDNPGWTRLTVDFKAPPATQLVTVGIARMPSRKFDNQISGKVWVDDVSLAPSSGE